MKRVKKFGVLQTSKVAAIIMFIISLIILLPVGLIVSVGGSLLQGGLPGYHPFLSGIFIIVMPFFYGLMGFVMTAISCLIYNVIVQWTGGIELEFETVDEPQG